MAVETMQKPASKSVEPSPDSRTVKMKYIGVTKGNSKIVSLPIPLISNSQKYEETLLFTRPAGTRGALFCDVPMKWAGMLVAVGGNWQLNEKSTPDLERQMADAKVATEREVEEFVRANELVDA